jgi:hypothetical protein
MFLTMRIKKKRPGEVVNELLIYLPRNQKQVLHSNL